MREDHPGPVGQLTGRQLDLYGNQLTRCLKALGTDAPIRADVQRELATVRAEQDHRGRPPMRDHDVTALTGRELEQARRDLAASLALARPDSPVRVPILAQMTAIDAEPADRSGARTGESPSSPPP
jgi:hypothetical protein